MKFSGFDGIVVYGKSEKPVYLWINDGVAELRDASHLMGKFTADVEDAIKEDLGDERIEVLQTGPAGEKGVHFAALITYANRAAGRTGMGAVMGSKNLKAIAVRGKQRPMVKDQSKIKEFTKFIIETDVGKTGFGVLGTPGGVLYQDKSGGLPTNNWNSGTFEGAPSIDGQVMYDTITKERDTCHACVVHCKRVNEVTEGPFKVNPRYGGPEYETIGMMGSLCGVSDLEAISLANELCNAYGLDTISCGGTIAWAMDCFEQGLLTTEDTGGIELRFGDAAAMVQITELIGKREGFGKVLGEGSAQAAETLGMGQDLVVAVKKQELPAHMPQVKRSLGLIYSVNPFGADHMSSDHDNGYAVYNARLAEFGLINPQPARVLNAEKVRFAYYTQLVYSFLDTMTVCAFVWGPSWQPYNSEQLVDMMRAVTGWNVTLFELLKVGERRLNLMRAFNDREGVGREADTVPKKLTQALSGGASDGVTVTVEEIEAAKDLYFEMVGWDEDGKPRRAKLEELSLGWVADELGLK
jgi:aldehyde:ferredoxin oxidoreductase